MYMYVYIISVREIGGKLFLEEKHIHTHTNRYTGARTHAHTRVCIYLHGRV